MVLKEATKTYVVENIMAYLDYYDIKLTVLGEYGCGTPDKWETKEIILAALAGHLTPTEYLREHEEV